jgi:hypothetical protein
VQPMKPFTSIDAFRNVVTSVKKYCAERGIPLPTIEYVGTVKLHGTNAGVRVTPDSVQPQKRSDIVSIGADNAGFAAFCHDKPKQFRDIAERFGDKDITLYGEWCGGAIQKGVALNQLDKHFVVFSVYDGINDKHVPLKNFTDLLHVGEFNKSDIWFINQVEPFRITVDFSKPEDSLAALEAFTLQVEEECPWGKFRGVSGVGEGIVWIPADAERNSITGLWFKTKGVKHAAKDGSKKGTNIEASPEKLESIRALVDRVLPAWRLEQGITVLKENGMEITPKNTGEFLKWVSQDILKEDVDIIVANGFDWKGIVKYIMPAARQFYLGKVDSEAFQQ